MNLISIDYTNEETVDLSLNRRRKLIESYSKSSYYNEILSNIENFSNFEIEGKKIY